MLWRGRAGSMRDPTRQAERLMAIRLRTTIHTHLEGPNVQPGLIAGRLHRIPAQVAPEHVGRHARPQHGFGRIYEPRDANEGQRRHGVPPRREVKPAHVPFEEPCRRTTPRRT